MSEDAALALLRLLAEEGEVSSPRAAKRLGLGASELQRLLVALGDDPHFGGLDLVEQQVETRAAHPPEKQGASTAATSRTGLRAQPRTLLRLTARGRALCAGADAGTPPRVPTDAHADTHTDRHMHGHPREGLCELPVQRLRVAIQDTPATSMTDAITTDDEINIGIDHAIDHVIEETPVALLYNGLPYAVMMATPTDLEDFALGFAIGEGIVAGVDEFRLVDCVRSEAGIALHAAIPQARYDALDDRRRNLEGRSGCGLCGVDSLQAAVRTPRRIERAPVVAAARIQRALDGLARRQPLNARSGGAHAAGFLPLTQDEDDDMAQLIVREDVGRHNALDKTIGALLRTTPAQDPAAGLLLVTSRASFELVHKAANAGIGVLVAMSAPTALAVRQADAAGVTLIAFARDGRMNVYSHPARLR